MSESLRYLLPEITLFSFGILILIFGLFSQRKIFCEGFALLAVAFSAATFLPAPAVTQYPFSGLLFNDSFSLFFRGLFLLIAFFVILISMGYREIEEERSEYYFFLLTLTAAMMLAVASNNLLMVYMSIEAISLISYILVAFLKRNIFSAEAALKYFLFGVLATGIMLYGISFIYGAFQTTDLTLIANALKDKSSYNPLILFFVILVFAGLGFKCGLVPFHMWVPDAYQGAPTPVSGLISVGPKAVGFALLVSIFQKSFLPFFPAWSDLAGAIAILTMSFGNIIAVSQTNIKRMLGYSSIAQAGYILIGFVAGTKFGITGLLFYILAYVLMNLGAFGSVAMISGSIKSEEIKDYAGLYKKDPFSAFLLTIFLLSLAGIPPLAGFVGKFLVFGAAIQDKQIALATVAVLNSVLAFYYYVKVIKYMYLEEPAVEGAGKRPVSLQLALFIIAVFILFIGIWPKPVLGLIMNSF